MRRRAETPASAHRHFPEVSKRNSKAVAEAFKLDFRSTHDDCPCAPHGHEKGHHKHEPRSSRILLGIHLQPGHELTSSRASSTKGVTTRSASRPNACGRLAGWSERFSQRRPFAARAIPDRRTVPLLVLLDPPVQTCPSNNPGYVLISCAIRRNRDLEAYSGRHIPNVPP
ncbi:hypothetical protein PsYK624_158090 [Phanerochaete sordida]|uniref:Uncharacterized protein n=1 Tax=Phanerochaete sordida TaxID=48140 RepID=A0A9P3GPV2_9APHY|nr:hypothetical protein PsYK624_158090 [Phanerochaete sordida]